MTDIWTALVAAARELALPIEIAAVDKSARQALFAGLGWDVDAIPGLNGPEVSAALAAVADRTSRLASLSEREDRSFAGVTELIAAVGEVVESIVALNGPAGAIEAGPSGEVMVAALNELGTDVLQFVTVQYLLRHHPVILQFARLLTLVDERTTSAVVDSGGSILRRVTPIPVIHFGRIADLVGDPQSVIAALVGTDGLSTVGSARAVAGRLLGPVSTVLAATGAVVTNGSDVASDATRSVAFSFPLATADNQVEIGALVRLLSSGEGGPGVGVTPWGQLSETFETRGFAIGLNVAAAAEGEFILRSDGMTAPPEGGHLIVEASIARRRESGPAFTTGQFAKAPPTDAGPLLRARFRYDTGDPPAFRFGGAGESALVVDYVAGEVAVEYEQDRIDVIGGLRLSGVEVIVRGTDGGFLDQVLGGAAVRGRGDLDLSWSIRGGLRGGGRAGIELVLPVDGSFGPVTVHALTVRGIISDAGLSVAATLSMDGWLGPLAVTMTGVGLSISMSSRVSAGQTDGLLRAGLLPPSGVGLALDMPGVRGGGFLELDGDRFVGFFQLTLFDLVSVTALAVVTERPRFALLIVITAQGFPPIPLGFGFTLTGIGGMLALNRAVDADVIRVGLRGGMLEAILSPDDPVRNVARVLQSLDRVFPAAEGRVVVGPLAEISWGSPTLVRVRVAVLLEVPAPIRVVVLASLAVALPNERQPLVELHVDAIGVLDIGRGELTLDASLHDSRLLSFTLHGDMALRLNWGDDPGFTLSVGGFHPRYRQPRSRRPVAGGRELERMTLSLTGVENPRFTLEAYLAITSNSIQFGARVSLYANAAGFGIEGGGGFDALVQWDPFAFDVSVEAWVRVFTPLGTLFGARVLVQVSGPSPWHVVGVLEITILFFTITVGVEFTSGEDAQQALPEPVDLVDKLWTALTEKGAWTVSANGYVPAARGGSSALTDDAGVDVVSPLSVLTLNQKLLPLRRRITRFGASYPAAGPREYDVVIEAPPGVRVVERWEPFAMGQVEDLTEDARLADPAFVRCVSGYSLESDPAGAFVTDDVAVTDFSAEQSPLDEGDARPPVIVFPPLPAWSWSPEPARLRARSEVLS